MTVEQQPGVDPYFGRCPLCLQGGTVMVTVGRDHWAICEPDKTRWWVGSNLFSAPQEQTEEEAEAQSAHLAPYREVEAVPDAVQTRLAPVIKFNNTGSAACCLVCGAVTDLEIGAQIFNEGSYDWVCDNCLDDRPESEMRVWRNRIHGWPDDTRIEPAYKLDPETPF